MCLSIVIVEVILNIVPAVKHDNKSFLNVEIKRKNARILARRNSGALARQYAKKLKIGVPGKNLFKDFVNATTQKVTGYCIDVFEAAVKKLPYDLDYEYNVFDGSYDELVHSVSSGVGEPCSPCTCMLFCENHTVTSYLLVVMTRSSMPQWVT